MMKLLPVFLIASILFISGCTTQTERVPEDGTTVLPNGTVAVPDGGTAAGGTASFNEAGLTKFANNYYRYDPAAFQAALDDGKVVFLDFHANWCSICNAERPAILDGFNSIDYDDVVGFQVHYNDGNTKSFDTEVIKKYQVAYQHTKVIIGSEGQVALKTLDVFSKNRVISEIEKTRNA